MRISLCLLTWNEIDGCRKDLPCIDTSAFCEVLAIDNGSTDGTVEYMQEQGVTVLRQKYPTYNGAYRHAFEVFSGDALVFFHPKGTIATHHLTAFAPLFEQGFGHVIGSRCIRGSSNEEDRHLIRYRKWFVLALGWTAYVLGGCRGPWIRDVLHGFRGVTRDALTHMTFSERGVSIDLEMVVQGYRHTIRQAEFPVQEIPRASGGTHFPAWRTGRRLLGYLFSDFIATLLPRTNR